MRITVRNMQDLSDALDELYALNVGEENLGFWLENRPGGLDVREARDEVVSRLPALHAACRSVIAVLDRRT